MPDPKLTPLPPTTRNTFHVIPAASSESMTLFSSVVSVRVMDGLREHERLLMENDRIADYTRGVKVPYDDGE